MSMSSASFPCPQRVMRGTYCSRLLNAILANGVSDDDSYSIVECSRVRKSNARSEPSAPTDTKISAERGSQHLQYKLLRTDIMSNDPEAYRSYTALS